MWCWTHLVSLVYVPLASRHKPLIPSTPPSSTSSLVTVSTRCPVPFVSICPRWWCWGATEPPGCCRQKRMLECRLPLNKRWDLDQLFNARFSLPNDNAFGFLQTIAIGSNIAGLIVSVIERGDHEETGFRRKASRKASSNRRKVLVDMLEVDRWAIWNWYDAAYDWVVSKSSICFNHRRNSRNEELLKSTWLRAPQATLGWREKWDDSRTVISDTDSFVLAIHESRRTQRRRPICETDRFDKLKIFESWNILITRVWTIKMMIFLNEKDECE